MSHFEKFLEVHMNQLTSSGVPQIYWATLFEKLKDEIYDAGNAFQMQQVVLESEGNGENDDNAPEAKGFYWRITCTVPEGIDLDEPEHIYLVDHAWTYRSNEAMAALQQVPGLLDRMVALMDIKSDGLTTEELRDKVLESMWQFNQTYRFGNFALGSDDSMPMWYIMDEFGSRIRHSDEPNCRLVPFFFAGSGLAYSILWPTKEIDMNEEVVRDYAEGEKDIEKRRAALIPWVDDDLTDISFAQEEPSVQHFESHRMEETLPPKDFEFGGLPKDRNVRVFVEYKEFIEHLTDARFEVVDDPSKADVLWFFRHFHEYKELTESNAQCLINQFPCENVLTVKDNLAIVARRAAKPEANDPFAPNPKWLPVTYNLQTELPKFVSYYQSRKKRGLDNHWICKPWNLARSLDTHVTNNLDHILRLRDSGPKVACKYIENPVLYHRPDINGMVKFDVRYIVLLSSVEPLKLYAYQVFWLRFANKPFSLDNLNDYEKHFTVMNYVDDAERKLKQVHYDEFIPQFEAQNPGFLWAEIENDIFGMVKELFQAAVSLPAPQGLYPSPQSRAMYAVDLMLAWDTKPSGEKVIQPMICEVNFSPDCARACKYHPFFVNDVFSVLFLDDTEDKHVVPL